MNFACGGWHRNLMFSYISTHPEYGQCKRLGTLCCWWGEAALLSTPYQSKNLHQEKQSGSKVTSSTKISIFQWLCAKENGLERKKRLPCLHATDSLCILGLTSKQRKEGAEVSRRRHSTNHNWKVLIIKSHH